VAVAVVGVAELFGFSIVAFFTMSDFAMTQIMPSPSYVLLYTHVT
jgi:hypothetical protein